MDVVPVGLAWQSAMDERPELNLYIGDGIHPNIHGTYLTVCVVYVTIFGVSPIRLTYLPSEDPGVNDDEGAFLQRIAWETVQDYQAQP